VSGAAVVASLATFSLPTTVGAPAPDVTAPAVEALPPSLVVVPEAVPDQSATASAPAERRSPPGRSFTVAAVGDFLPEPLINHPAAALAPPGVRYDYAALLKPVAPILSFADLAICHMETPVGGPGATVGWVGKSAYGTNLLQTAWETPFDMKRVGFDRCSTASNHSNDQGSAGIDATLKALDAARITHAGTARTPKEAQVTTFMVNGVRVAHLSYARNSNTGFPSDLWRLNRAVDANKVKADVATARKLGAEVVVVSLHVYVEMQTGPVANDRALVNAITAAAAKPDLVIIHGPHVPQPMERVNGIVTYWSVGNFISGMGAPNRGKYADPRTLDGLLALVRFTQRSNGTWAVEPYTVLLCNTPADRKVYPGLSTLKDPGISPTIRAQLNACVGRASKVVSGLH
jgi:poly-gamma-glutamate synthesis protein (capsule biosynthesis protein)